MEGSKEAKQFNALAAEQIIGNPSNEVRLLLTGKAEVFFCWKCGENTLHEHIGKDWICIYSYSHRT